MAGLRVGHWHAITAGVLAIIALTAIGVGIRLIDHQSELRRELLVRVEPSDRDVLRLGAALTQQEIAVRGYVLTAEPELLEPYTSGLRDERAALRRLRRLATAGPTRELGGDLDAVTARAEQWRAAYAQPAIDRVQRVRTPTPTPPRVRGATSQAGAPQFDGVRRAVARLQAHVARVTATARERLDAAAQGVRVAFAIVAAILVVSILAVAAVLRRTVMRPLAALGEGARLVAAGDLSRSLHVQGPRDVEQLAGDVDVMRARLVEELASAEAARAALAARGSELQRSNAELEQFAYVISHDLQEPLRKVTSFCELLQRRYGERLDARADEYIAFAVDGARRMQGLIDDLLALSRVGRGTAEVQDTDLGRLAARACANLEHAIALSGADVTIDELPTVPVDPVQVTAVFEHLIDNAIKFRSDAAPVVRIAARDDGDRWIISCTDNGIGVEEAYGERIFGVFQRLHPRERYEGSGIGLAICRKVVERHGGRIWLASDARRGAQILFSLPTDAARMPAMSPAERTSADPSTGDA